MNPVLGTRRDFFGKAVGILGAVCAGSAWGEEGLVPTRPCATDGDDRSEPAWDERLTVRVGCKEGDLVGSDDKVIQAAARFRRATGRRYRPASAGNLYAAQCRLLAVPCPLAGQR